MLDQIREIRLDLKTVTFDEMVAIELGSGRTFLTLLKSQQAQIVIALYLQEWRSSGVEPSWKEISSRRPLDSGSSTSASPSAGHPAKSAA